MLDPRTGVSLGFGLKKEQKGQKISQLLYMMNS